MRWNPTGTANQQAIAREAFDRIKFPFDALTLLPGTPELGWVDLNSRMMDAALHHEEHHGGEDKPDSLEGEIDGRRWIMGVIYTQSARIYLDVRLERNPELAMAVVGAEIAHAVDYFLPMNDDQRNAFLTLWGSGGTWWERYDYGSEYYTLGGEAFMHEFVGAYSDMQFGDKSAFSHDVGVEPEDVRRILGIQRTDYVAPVYEPALEPTEFKHFPGGKDIYHKKGHYGLSRGVPLTSLEGFLPCKVCKPDV